MKLPEELVEEEDMSILVSLASLFCLILLPVILFFSLQFKGSLQNGLLMHWLDTQLQQIWPDHPILFDFWRRG
ncbi:unnamed protein product [Brassica oleracea]